MCMYVLEMFLGSVLCWWDETRVVQDCMRRGVQWLHFPGYFFTSCSYSELYIILSTVMVVSCQFFMKIVWIVVLEVVTL